MATKSERNFVVLGGVGAIGRVVVRDLFESHPQNHILIADYNESGARVYARSFRSRHISAAFADATKPGHLAKLLRGHALVINCTQHDFNLNVMRAALAAKVHYLDLGGLFYWTRKQLKLNSQFKRAGLTAILGMGCSPGITNVMTRAAVDKLGNVESVRIRVGAKDFNAKPADFFFPYSAQTIVEELTLTPWVFERGKFREVQPRAGWERINFSQAGRPAMGCAHTPQRSGDDSAVVWHHGLVSAISKYVLTGVRARSGQATEKRLDGPRFRQTARTARQAERL
jgi:saccharopine dehydrogenase-like NADP-dependent oxidoreductase